MGSVSFTVTRRYATTEHRSGAVTGSRPPSPAPGVVTTPHPPTLGRRHLDRADRCRSARSWHRASSRLPRFCRGSTSARHTSRSGRSPPPDRNAKPDRYRDPYRIGRSDAVPVPGSGPVPAGRARPPHPAPASRGGHRDTAIGGRCGIYSRTKMRPYLARVRYDVTSYERDSRRETF